MSTAASNDANDPEILVEVNDGIGRISFNRPATRNPLGLETCGQLHAAFNRLENDPDCRVVILTGSGAAFCGGADIKNMLTIEDADTEYQLGMIQEAFSLTKRVRELELPVIAAVNGHAVGGGAALALACDIAIASTDANYYFAFGRIGASGADMGCTYMLPRHVGVTKAAHLILTGATVDAAMGLELGLFVEVVSPEALLGKAEDIARQIIQAYPRRAAANTKSALFRGETTDLGTCLSYEAIAQTYMFRTQEHKDLRDKFLKRWE